MSVFCIKTKRMKYFTTLTLTILAVNAYASTPATTTNAPNEPESFTGKFVSDAKEFFDQLSESIKHVFYPAKDNIKYHLEIPKPKDADVIAPYDPKDNLCSAGNESEYWDGLFKEKDPEKVIKIVFCPNALTYLSHANGATLTSNAKDQDLRNILVALMLRSKTLNKSYLDSFMLKNYFECFKTLKSKLKSNNDPWPCKDVSTCDASSIKDNFAKFADETQSCKEVLKDQLLVYAEKVAEAAVDQKFQTSVAVRESILENLNNTPQLSLPFNFLYDGVVEGNKTAARASIELAIRDTCGTLEMQSDKNSTVCNDAKAAFEQRLNKPSAPAPENVGASGASSETKDANVVTEVKKEEPKEVPSTEEPKDTPPPAATAAATSVETKPDSKSSAEAQTASNSSSAPVDTKDSSVKSDENPTPTNKEPTKTVK